jgi:hypothetical protein
MARVAETLHLKVSFIGSFIVFIPDNKHWPAYAEGVKLGHCTSVEEAQGFLNGFCRACEYFELGKGEKK